VIKKTFTAISIISLLFSCAKFDSEILKQSFNDNPQKYTNFIKEIQDCYSVLDSSYNFKMTDGSFLITHLNRPSDDLFSSKLSKQLKNKEMTIKCLSKRHIEFRYIEKGHLNWKAIYFVHTLKTESELKSIYNTTNSRIEKIEKKEGLWYIVEVIQSAS